MAQNYSYPSSSQVTITGIGDPIGAPVPADAVLMGVEDPSGNLQPLFSDTDGSLLVTTGSQSFSNVNIQEINGAALTLGQKVSTTSLPVVLASDQSALTVKIKDSAGNSLTSTGSALDINLKTSSITLPVSAVSLPLPSGAATETTLSAMSAKLPATLGAQLIAASLSVNIASNQTVPISAASLPLPSGAATDASVTNVQGTVAAGTAATKSGLIGGVFNTSLPTVTNGQQVAMQLDSSGRQIIAPLANTSIVKAQLQDNAGTAITLGSKVSASSVPVVIASDQASIPVANTPSSSSTATLTNVSSSASSVTLLSSNASRKGATIYNDSTALVYVKFGTTASSTSYTVQIAAGGYYELPFTGQGLYTGRIDGIWASANGNARVTELT